MHSYRTIALLLLFLFLTLNVDAEDNDDLEKKKDEQKNNDEYVKNGIHYREEGGNLYYVGKTDSYSEEINLFFKKEAALSTPHFKIAFCLDPDMPTCEKGIILCYQSQLKEKYTRKEFRADTFVLRKRKPNHEPIECEQHEHFGIRVKADKENFTVQATLDDHDYVFPIPEITNNGRRCFVLNMGSNTSLETTITNVNGEQLVFVGNAPKKFLNDTPNSLFYKKNDKTMNLWMLFIDFTPFYPDDFIYFRRPIYFRGGGDDCGLTAEFDKESFHVCMEIKELIGMCDAKYLDSADMDCAATLVASQSVEQGTEKEESSSITDTNSKKKTDTKEEGETDQISIGLDITFKAGIFITEMSSNHQYGYANTLESKHIWSTETGSEKSKTTATSEVESWKEVIGKGNTLDLKIHRTDGGKVKLYQLTLHCSGDVRRYHKIFAEGDRDHSIKGKPQATTVYEWNNESQVPTFNLVLPSVKPLDGIQLEHNIVEKIDHPKSKSAHRNPFSIVEHDKKR